MLSAPGQRIDTIMGNLPTTKRRFGFTLGRYEWRLTITGLVLGVVLGLSMGGVGIAAKGTAIGLPAGLVLGLLMALVGNRVGIEWDRRRPL